MKIDAQIVFALCGGFVVGVLVRSVAPVGIAAVLFLVLMAGTVLVASLGKRERVMRASIAAVALLAVAFGMWRMDASVLRGDPYLDARVGKEVTLEGAVVAEPDVREGSVRVNVVATAGPPVSEFLRPAERKRSHARLAGGLRVRSSDEKYGNRQSDLSTSTALIHATVLAVAPAHTAVAYGDRVRVHGTVRLPESFDTGLGRQFDYPGYLAVSGIGYELARAHVETLEPAPCCSLAGFAIGVKQWYAAGLRAALPEPQSSLAAGITAGDKRGLGKETAEEFRAVSLTHIIVLSGYNITIVAYAVMGALAQIAAPRWVRIGAGGFVALFFALMTGGASASVRAAAMAAIAMSASATRRIFDPARALALVAFGMAAWNPYVVAFDPGFQLSVLAVAGLILLAPVFEERMRRVPQAWGLREVCVSTASAQLAVLPLLLYQSGTLSLAAFPANILVLAFVPAAMTVSALAALGGLALGPLAPVVALPAYALLSYILYVPHLLAHISHAALSIPAFSGWWLAPAYLFVFLVIPRAIKKTAA